MRHPKSKPITSTTQWQLWLTCCRRPRPRIEDFFLSLIEASWRENASRWLDTFISDGNWRRQTDGLQSNRKNKERMVPTWNNRWNGDVTIYFFQLNSFGNRRKEKSIIIAVNYSSSSLNLESGEEWKTQKEIDNYEESDHLTWTRPVGPFIRHLFRFNRLCP